MRIWVDPAQLPAQSRRRTGGIYQENPSQWAKILPSGNFQTTVIFNNLFVSGLEGCIVLTLTLIPIVHSNKEKINYL